MMKTKCYYFFLSLTLVSLLTFSAVDCSVHNHPYVIDVRFTNYAFQHCSGETLAVLIDVFVRRQQLPMRELSYMFAVPDKADTNLQQSIDREVEIRNELSNISTIPEPVFDEVADISLLSGLGAERRVLDRYAMRVAIRKLLKKKTMDEQLCRSLGLLRSVLDPESYITSFRIQCETCIIISSASNPPNSSKFKYIDGVLCQVQIGVTNRTELFSYDQLR
ncbi:uncharacterized protein LOC126843036 [Adelges cooleyi]|uniref:uncharacterized protein LOC126843036 n=1 Tax=Adelges cooleyi TaxID=133065 RepID=UPI00217F7D5A|nr:uncharacterized protein LOC126843036 [Adelges cooleyi]